MLEPIVLPSPNKKYKAVLTYIGEIQADQACYSLLIEGLLQYSFIERIFGKVCLWSPESRYLAVQEWKEPEDDDAPRYCLLSIIDVVARRECIIANVEGTKGNILPESFIGESLMYTVIYFGQFGMTKSFETKFRYLDGWQTFK
jgi:hypothetical protein